MLNDFVKLRNKFKPIRADIAYAKNLSQDIIRRVRRHLKCCGWGRVQAHRIECSTLWALSRVTREHF